MREKYYVSITNKNQTYNLTSLQKEKIESSSIQNTLLVENGMKLSVSGGIKGEVAITGYIEPDVNASAIIETPHESHLHNNNHKKQESLNEKPTKNLPNGTAEKEKVTKPAEKVQHSKKQEEIKTANNIHPKNPQQNTKTETSKTDLSHKKVSSEKPKTAAPEEEGDSLDEDLDIDSDEDMDIEEESDEKVKTSKKHSDKGKKRR